MPTRGASQKAHLHGGFFILIEPFSNYVEGLFYAVGEIKELKFQCLNYDCY